MDRDPEHQILEDLQMATMRWIESAGRPARETDTVLLDRCLELLKGLLASGWECEKGDLQDKECFHCGGEFCYDGPGSGHKPDCDYLAAEAFVAAIEARSPEKADDKA